MTTINTDIPFKIMLTGATGQLGKCLMDRFPSHWSIYDYSSQTLDISDENLVELTVKKISPDYIINAAAYTAVDKAEDEPEKAESINHLGAKYLAQAAHKYHARLIHVSTDYVFDGHSTEPYTESDPTNPQSVYGHSKLAGEKAATEALEDLIIIRTAWVFSEYGQNFYLTMRRLFEQRSSLSIVNDQIGKPTYAGDLAQAIIQSIQNAIPSGIYHYSGNHAVSWYQFTHSILGSMPDEIHQKITLIPIPSIEYPQKACRPAYSVLSNAKIEALGIASSDWQAAIVHLANR